jgi:hypothetical protein
VEDGTLKRLLDAETEAEQAVVRADTGRQPSSIRQHAMPSYWKSNRPSALLKSALPLFHRLNFGQNRPSPRCNGAMVSRPLRFVPQPSTTNRMR